MNCTRLALFVALAIAGVSCNDLQVGSIEGRIVFNETIQASPAIWRQSQRITINVTDQEVISCVMVQDHRAEKDGEATIVEGGKGEQNVTIELKSPTVFRGFDFNVIVYAALGSVQHPSHNDAQHPAVLKGDTDLNTSAKPEKESVDIVTSKATETTPKVTGTTAGHGTTEKVTDAPRKSRNTEQQQVQDAIVKFVTEKVEKEQSTTESTITTEASPMTTGTLKVNKPIDVAYPKVSSTTEHNKVKEITQNVQSTLPTKNFEDHTQSTEVPSFVSTTENTHGNKYDSVSKELGQKVVFGIKKHS